MRRLAFALISSFAASGCAGAAPLLHPAHVLRPGVVSTGAGFSGEAALLRRPAPATSGPASSADRTNELEKLAVAPGIAPWAAARVGIAGSNEAGLTVTGRAFRLDGRHAFSLGAPTLSVGLGASALVASRPGGDPDARGVLGGGFDLPVLLGFQSTEDLYALWLGPRVGLDLIHGQAAMPGADPSRPALVDVSGQHLQLGFVLGIRAGFRHIHGAIEIGAAYHYARGKIGGSSASVEQATVAPGGGLVATF